MEERDNLATLLFGADGSDKLCVGECAPLADAILAAGYRRDRPVVERTIW